MKKIKLNKIVLARISDNEMNFLEGGQSDNACTSTQTRCQTTYCQSYMVCSVYGCGNTCGTAWTCNG